jgi:hypothetical protein
LRKEIVDGGASTPKQTSNTYLDIGCEDMSEMNYLHISKQLQERLIKSAERNAIRSGRAPWATRARMILEKALDEEERNGGSKK